MPLIETAGGAIAHTIEGTGAEAIGEKRPPVVLCLPQSSGPAGVGAFVAGLAATHTVIRYDQRGTGDSAPPADPEAITMPDRAGEVRDLGVALGIERLHLVCHSTGCGIGLAFAAAYPAMLDRLVLVSPWSHGDAYLTSMQRLRIAAARALGSRDYAIFNASLLFPPAYRRAQGEGFAALAAAALPPDADRIAGRLEAILSFDARPLLPAIQAPTLAISSADDQLMPAWFGRAIAAGLPAGRYEELPGGGHMLLETEAAVLVETVGAFLAGDGGG